jgi:3-oxoacyl-[acyl-carrier protein] reductase
LPQRASDDLLRALGHETAGATARGRAAVAIVTGGSTGTGRDVARGLARWGWRVVVVYLEDQDRAEATVAEILDTDGIVVAVRADLSDDLDVQRLFTESRAAFAVVDVVVHTMPNSPSVLLCHAAQHVRRHGAIVCVMAADGMAPTVVRRMAERGISVHRAGPREVLPLLARWARHEIA